MSSRTVPTARSPWWSARAGASRRSCTTRRWRRARARRPRAPRRGSRSRTSACRPSCAPGWRSCAPRARASSRRPTPSAAASSATCTTARSSGWSSIAMTLGLADSRLRASRTPARSRCCARRAASSPDALDELRELAQGIHPPDPHRARPARGARGARLPRARAARRSTSSCRERLPEARRGGRLLRRLRGADQRRQARRRDARSRCAYGAPRRAARCVEVRRRRRRRRRRRAAPACAASPTASTRSAAACAWTARRRRHRLRRGDPMRVVLADDSVLLREGLARLLREAGFEVVGAGGDADDAARARRRAPARRRDRRHPHAADPHRRGAARGARRSAQRHPRRRRSSCSRSTSSAGYACELLADGAEGVGYLLKDRVPTSASSPTRVRRSRGRLGARPRGRRAARRPRARAGDPLDGPDEREREVLALMAEGRSNRAIARAARRSPSKRSRSTSATSSASSGCPHARRPPARAGGAAYLGA